MLNYVALKLQNINLYVSRINDFSKTYLVSKSNVCRNNKNLEKGMLPTISERYIGIKSSILHKFLRNCGAIIACPHRMNS